MSRPTTTTDMTRKEQIEQAATESCQHLPECKIYFKMGAEWADKNPNWISVEDKLPKDDEWVLGYCPVQGRVLFLRYFNGHFYIYVDGVITHWMPIPTPPNKDKDGTK